MEEFIIDISNYKISKKMLENMQKKLCYLSEQIKSFDIITGSQYIEQVRLRCSSYKDLDQKFLFFLEKEFCTQPVIEKIVWKSQKTADANEYEDVFEELVREEKVYPFGTGRMAIGNPLVGLIRFFDEEIRRFCVSALHAEEFLYPSVVSATVVKKCGYFISSPQLIFFVNRFYHDFDNYSNFIVDLKSNKPNFNLWDYCHGDLELCLPPTVCYHTYEQLHGKTIGNYVITSLGKAFRDEDKAAKSLERLWDFTIREIVFFGEYQFVNNIRQQIMEFMYGLVDKLQLSGICCSASDPFFCDDSADYKIKYQMSMNAKLELVLDISDGKKISVGSFNFHDSFFCRNFQISHETGSPMVSGCTGFGLERLAYAFLCQHGLDPSNWPICIDR